MLEICISAADLATMLREEYNKALITPSHINTWYRVAEGVILKINKLGDDID